ncbi:hypothetical protein [Weissella ceti]|uniref:Uncharacterized protein n=1 Tax=Weissella ceti TaxID=759620 RepID=A0A088GGI6_9LACO|nr:hypothetical protein [Weissella ceti]AIM63091.1 hypothetical protein WS74_0839 [Weissella ceti]
MTNTKKHNLLKELDQEANELSVKINRLEAQLASGSGSLNDEWTKWQVSKLESMKGTREAIIQQRALLIRDLWGN